MSKPKKGSGNQDPNLPPVRVSSKRKKGLEGEASGTSEAGGGSREGNAGHQNDPYQGKGDRQV